MKQFFKEKCVAVAASSKGLGYAIAYEAAKDGADVFMGSRNEESLTSACLRIKEQTGGHVSSCVLDVTSALSIQEWVKQCYERYKKIDCLVVNTGGPKTGPFESFSDSDWEEAFTLVILSTVRLIRSTLPIMKKNNGGSIVTITSSSIKEPIDNLLFSNVMRSGVASMIKTLSRELISNNIRLNTAVPGTFNTDRLNALDSEKALKTGKTIEQIHADAFSLIPMNRYGEPREFAKAVLFLLSDAASYITGASLVVDGGRMRSTW